MDFDFDNDDRFVARKSYNLLSTSSYMRSIATNAAAAAIAAKAPPFWPCAMGAAAEVPEVLLADVAAVAVPVPELVALPLLLGEVVPGVV
jgi:hypothetical protein